MAKNSSSVLQSLTATYTDSEGEEDEDRSENRKRRSSSLNADEERQSETTEVGTKESSVAASNASPDSVVSGTNTPQSGSSASGNMHFSYSTTSKKNLIFSYQFQLLRFVELQPDSSLTTMMKQCLTTTMMTTKKTATAE